MLVTGQVRTRKLKTQGSQGIVKAVLERALEEFLSGYHCLCASE